MGVLQGVKHVHIVGVKGVAMAGIARILHQMGVRVSGSDTEEDQITDGMLAESGIPCNPLNDTLPADTDLVVYSAAHGGVKSQQVQSAIQRGIRTFHQAELIAEFIGMFPTSIAVCGCHGKTGTTALLAYALSRMGAKVSWLVGAPYFKTKEQSTGYRVQGTEDVIGGGEKAPTRLWREAKPQTSENTFPGGHYEEGSEVFVFEADEYGMSPPDDTTPKLMLYYPTHILCTNIDFDHPDIYRDLDQVRTVFHEFFTHAPNVYQCHSSSIEGNIRGVMALMQDLGHDPVRVEEVIRDFAGVARRMEYHGESNGVVLIDDYAHHPAEIVVTLSQIRSKYPDRRIIAAFQSHTYSRTNRLKLQFVEALAQADIALIDSVFPSARESADEPTITALDLAKLARQKGYGNIMGFARRADLVAYVRSILRSGDVLLTLGAGDIYKIISNMKNQKAKIFQKSKRSQPKADPSLTEKIIIMHDYPIGDKFTWKVETTARYYARIHTEDDVRSLVESREFINSEKRYILGRGANTLFASSYYDGLVIEIDTKGVENIREDADYSYWRVAAGEDWIELVERMVLQENMGGLENLAYIPGKVGSAPIQNIAAYGQAFEDVCVSVDCIDLKTLAHQTYSRQDCEFAYRQSKFKSMLKTTHHGFIIWSVVLKLTKPSRHTIEADYFSNYESLQSELGHVGGVRPTIQDIYHAVVRLRKKKLPEVSDVGTNGSLFMNPIVKGSQVIKLLERFPKLQYYPTEKMKYVRSTEYKVQSTKRYKIAAGHIFDEIGWKGRRIGQVGTWDRHALVLCNYGTRDPGDIIKVIEMMQDDFEDVTGIRLDPEINIVYS